jgi:hypothetical protein
VNHHSALCLLIYGLNLAGCEHEPTSTAPPASAEAKSTPPPDLGSAHAAADAMDSRTPVPLLPRMAQHQKQNMRDHLLVVQEVTTALTRGDFDAAGRAAQRIASSARMTQTCEHMGSHAPGFTELALEFHRTADTLVAATRKRDRDDVLAALGHTLNACTSCHAAYKQQIVDETTWASLSTAATPARPHSPPSP